MRIARVEPPKEGGSYARALRAVQKHLPHAGEDVAAELAKLTSEDAPPIPCPPRIAIIPGLGPNVTVIKVRVKSSDMTKGRSGGLRALLQNVGGSTWRYLLVYAKNAREDVARDAVLEAIRTSQ